MVNNYIQAKNYTKAKDRDVRLIVLHTMEAPEKPGTALAVAKWFGGPNAPQASAHYCIDDASITQCVSEDDVAWAAPGANKIGIHLEHAGYAKQNAADWSDAYSESMLQLSAKLAAEIAFRHAIPLVKLSSLDIAAGKAGFCGHRDCTEAFAIKGGHTDPGANFPWGHYMQLVQAAAQELCYNGSD